MRKLTEEEKIESKLRRKEKQKLYRNRPEVRIRRREIARRSFKKWYSKPENKLKSYEYKKNWVKNHEVEYREYRKEYYIRNRESILDKHHNNKAREKEISFKSNLKTCYNLTVEEYNEMVKRQCGVCLICGKPDKRRNLGVDHDHKTGKIRGLLCSGCNGSLGWYELFKDNIIKYLENA